MLDHRTRWLGVLIVALVGLVFAPAAHGQSETGSFEVDFIRPKTVDPGATYTFEVRITNKSTKHSLGSANLYAPIAFRDIQAPRVSKGTISTASGVIETRNLGLKPGEHVDVSFRSTIHSKACGDFEWNARAKLPSDFHPSGNDFVLDRLASELVIDTTRKCDLRFAVQPKAARVGESIRGVEFAPNSEKLVSVQLLDADGQPSSAVASVKMKLEQFHRGEGTLYGTTAEDVINGVAAFDDIRVSEPGGYRLVAVTGGEAVAQAKSESFTVETQAVSCEPNVDCTVKISRSDIQPAPLDEAEQSTVASSDTTDAYSSAGLMATSIVPTATTGTVTLEATAHADSNTGTLKVSLFNYALHDCSDYPEPAISDGKVDGLPRRKRVSLTYSSVLLGGRTAAQLEMCFAAPYAFLTEGIPSTADTDSDGTPDSVSGRLPDCTLWALVTSERLQPCVTSRVTTRDSSGNVLSATIVVDVPANPLDPMYR